MKKHTTVYPLSCSQAYFHIMSIVTLTFDFWSPKSIGSILSLWLTCLLSFMKKHTTVSLYHNYRLTTIYVYRDLHLWPLTSKINRAHSLTIANMSAKFGKEADNSLVSIVFTTLFPYMSILTLTSKIIGVYPVVKVNMSGKFNEEEHNGLVSIVSARSTDGGTHRRNHSSVTISSP